MAYDKYTWQTGEVITAEKLNHIEDGIADMEGGDAGYECTETVTELFNETVTTTESQGVNMATFAYSQNITADVLRVTFDGVEYTCERTNVSSISLYGASNPTDFSEYPFLIQTNGTGTNMIYTESAGEHSVNAKAVDISLSTTPCFERAVQYILPDAKKIVLVDLNNTTIPQSELAKFQKAVQDADSYAIGVYRNTLLPFTEIRSNQAGLVALFQKMVAQNANSIIVTTISASFSGTVSVETYPIMIPKSGN